MLRTLTMKQRLLALAALALVGIGALAALAVGSNQVNRQALAEMHARDIGLLVNLQSIENRLLELRFRVAGVLLDQLPVQGSLNHLRDATKDLGGFWAELAPRAEAGLDDAESRALFEQMKTNWPQVDQLLRRLEQGYQQKDTKLLTALLEDEWPVLYKNVVKPLQALIPRTRAASAQAYEAAVQRSRSMLGLGLGTGLLCLLGVSLGAALTTRSLLRTVGAEPVAAAAVVQSVAAGELGTRIALRDGDNSSLMAQLKVMQDSLAHTVGGVRRIAEALAASSVHIAQGNGDLAGRTEQQAGALEQAAAAMDQLSVTVRQNADHAAQANGLADGASAVAGQGGRLMGQVVDTMKGINASSTRIANIIGVIDGLAFQTNILALNAAVEAARAGEQGRGFAVVASEVRNLAQRSAEAAKEIKTLITDSVEQVERGTALVEDAGRTMQQIVASIERVNAIMNNISAASREQDQGVAQVSSAVAQIDQATRQNADLVKQGTAAAGALTDHAQALVQAVSVFKLDGHPLSLAPRSRPAAAASLFVPDRSVKPAAPPARQDLAAAGQDWTTF